MIQTREQKLSEVAGVLATASRKVSAASLVRLLENRIVTESLSRSSTQDKWTIIGSGSLGDKARDLLLKTPAILESGFKTNDRAVLAMGFFDDFVARNGISGTNRQRALSKIMTKEFSSQERETIRQIAERFNGKPVVVRSSAYGDSRGTGFYDSFMLRNSSVERVERAIRKVLASQFGQNAMVFRKDAGLPEGMAVMIEPVVGKMIKGEYGGKFFAPNLSGFGYTSTASGEGYIQLVSGLPLDAVQKGKGMKITASQAKEDFLDLVEGYSRNLIYTGGADSLFGDCLGIKDGKAINREYGIVTGAVNGLGGLPRDFAPMFEKMKRLEEACGKPQYFEWAGVMRGDKLVVTILQTADVSPKVDFFEFGENVGPVVITANRVWGSNKLECDGFVWVINPNDVWALGKYNEEHSNYAVLYASRLRTFDMIQYHHLSNASVVMESPDSGRTTDPFSHWGGKLDTTKKVFFVTMNWDYERIHKLEEEGKGRRIEDTTCTIYDVKLRVTASERQGKAIVELIE
ncbi:MAG: PEP/pyruvate-binding domain-containing protein [Nitrospirota bacterium]